MTYGSPALQWQLMRSNSSFVRKNKIAGCPIFSAEKNNLLNIHSANFSALAASSVLGVEQSPNGGIVITSGEKNKHDVRGGVKVQSVRKGASSRFAQKAAYKAACPSRFDLCQAAIKRASVISNIGRHQSKTQKPRHKATAAVQTAA